MKDRIKEIRKSMPECGKTQEDFARFLGIPKPNLSSYETGRRVPTDAVIQLICSKCNVNENWLRTGDGEMKKPTPDMNFMEVCTKIGISDEKAKQAIMNYWQLSQSDRELFWAFVEKIMKAGD